MRRKVEPLLCELHAHTRWSDGALTLPELVDLYGTQRLRRPRRHRPCRPRETRRRAPVRRAGREPRRLPRRDRRAGGTGETRLRPARPAGPRADLRRPRSVRLGAHGRGRPARLRRGGRRRRGGARSRARRRGRSDRGSSLPPGRRRSPARASDAALLTRLGRAGAARRPWELFNRRELFAWVAERELPAVASGDFHRPEHLFGWKTLLPCAKREDAVVDYLRSGRPAFLTRTDDVPLLRAA